MRGRGTDSLARRSALLALPVRRGCGGDASTLAASSGLTARSVWMKHLNSGLKITARCTHDVAEHLNDGGSPAFKST